MKIIIIAVISIAPDLTDKSEHALYKINNNMYLKTSNMINYIIILKCL